MLSLVKSVKWVDSTLD